MTEMATWPRSSMPRTERWRPITSTAPLAKSSAPPDRWPGPIPSVSPRNTRMTRAICSTTASDIISHQPGLGQVEIQRWNEVVKTSTFSSKTIRLIISIFLDFMAIQSKDQVARTQCRRFARFAFARTLKLRSVPQTQVRTYPRFIKIHSMVV